MNIESLKCFLEEEISPKDLAILLNELYDNYVDLIVRNQLIDDEIKLDINTSKCIHTLRRLRDSLILCQ